MTPKMAQLDGIGEDLSSILAMSPMQILAPPNSTGPPLALRLDWQWANSTRLSYIAALKDHSMSGYHDVRLQMVSADLTLPPSKTINKASTTMRQPASCPTEPTDGGCFPFVTEVVYAKLTSDSHFWHSGTAHTAQSIQWTDGQMNGQAHWMHNMPRFSQKTSAVTEQYPLRFFLRFGNVWKLSSELMRSRQQRPSVASQQVKFD